MRFCSHASAPRVDSCARAASSRATRSALSVRLRGGAKSCFGIRECHKRELFPSRRRRNILMMARASSPVDKAVSSCRRIHRGAILMQVTDEVAFLFDVDNTLLDNDRIAKDLKDHLAYEFGPGSRDRYWTIFEERRQEVGYADYLGALQRYRLELNNDPRLLLM